MSEIDGRYSAEFVKVQENFNVAVKQSPIFAKWPQYLSKLQKTPKIRTVFMFANLEVLQVQSIIHENTFSFVRFQLIFQFRENSPTQN